MFKKFKNFEFRYYKLNQVAWTNRSWFVTSYMLLPKSNFLLAKSELMSLNYLKSAKSMFSVETRNTLQYSKTNKYITHCTIKIKQYKRQINELCSTSQGYFNIQFVYITDSSFHQKNNFRNLEISITKLTPSFSITSFTKLLFFSIILLWLRKK